MRRIHALKSKRAETTNILVVSSVESIVGAENTHSESHHWVVIIAISMFSRNCKHYQTQQKHCKHHTFGILNATSIIYAMDMGRVFAMLYLYITFTLALAIARCVQFSWIAYIACECVLLLNELNTIHDGGWNCCSDNDSWIGFRVSPIRLTIFSSMYLNCNIAEAVAENAALYFILNVSCKVTMTLCYARISIFIWLCPFFRWISMVWYVSVWQKKTVFFHYCFIECQFLCTHVLTYSKRLNIQISRNWMPLNMCTSGTLFMLLMNLCAGH